MCFLWVKKEKTEGFKRININKKGLMVLVCPPAPCWMQTETQRCGGGDESCVPAVVLTALSELLTVSEPQSAEAAVVVKYHYANALANARACMRTPVMVPYPSFCSTDATDTRTKEGVTLVGDRDRPRHALVWGCHVCSVCVCV